MLLFVLLTLKLGGCGLELQSLYVKDCSWVAFALPRS